MTPNFPAASPLSPSEPGSGAAAPELPPGAFASLDPQSCQDLRASPRALWQAPLADVLGATAGRELSASWKLMLLGDGGPTRHLQLLSGHPVSVEVIAMAPQPCREPSDPDEVSELVTPLLRRQVWLVCNGETLAWAESWWNRQQAEIHLRDRRQPIWSSLTAGRAELFREVDGLAQVEAPWLAQRFGLPGPYWSRHYRFFRGGRELTVIREVFSPAVERWLGPATRRPFNPEGLGGSLQNDPDPMAVST